MWVAVVAAAVCLGLPYSPAALSKAPLSRLTIIVLGFTVPLVAARHLQVSGQVHLARHIRIRPYLNVINYVVLYYLCAYACNALCLWSIPCLESVRAR